MPVDHFSLIVPNAHLDPLAHFLYAALAPLGYKEHFRPVPSVVGLGDDKPFLWLVGLDIPSPAAPAPAAAPAASSTTSPSGPVGGDGDGEGSVAGTMAKVLRKQHVAFTAESGDQVRAFYAAALKAGGADNGPPGLRLHYHPGYYAAFVRDPACGINFEVVCHAGPGEETGKKE